MLAESPTPTRSLTPTPSWAQDSTLDDIIQPQPEEETSPDTAVFEKKWIVTEVGGDDGTCPFLPLLIHLVDFTFPFTLINSRESYCRFCFITCKLDLFRIQMASRRTASSSTLISTPA